MRILLWNTEWASPQKGSGKYIKDYASSNKVEVICYTEIKDGLEPSGGYFIKSEADYGYSKTVGKRKVALWSDEPWSEVDSIGSAKLPSGRFVTGITKGIRFVGVCIPWRDAHVRTGNKNKLPWEDHLEYLLELKVLLSEFADKSQPICILGDFNQRIPRGRQPESVYNALQDILDEGYMTPTSKVLDNEDKQLIDHISVSQGISVTVDEIHPCFTKEGMRLSDHVGILASVHISGRWAS